MSHLPNFALRDYLALAALAILLLIGLRALSSAMAESDDDEEPDEPEDLLWEFEKARAAGELSEEEFKKIRASLLGGTVGQTSGSRKTSSHDRAAQTALPDAPQGPGAPVESPGPTETNVEPSPQPEAPEAGLESRPSDPEP